MVPCWTVEPCLQSIRNGDDRAVDALGRSPSLLRVGSFTRSTQPSMTETVSNYQLVGFSECARWVLKEYSVASWAQLAEGRNVSQRSPAMPRQARIRKPRRRTITRSTARSKSSPVRIGSFRSRSTARSSDPSTGSVSEACVAGERAACRPNSLSRRERVRCGQLRVHILRCTVTAHMTAEDLCAVSSVASGRWRAGRQHATEHAVTMFPL